LAEAAAVVAVEALERVVNTTLRLAAAVVAAAQLLARAGLVVVVAVAHPEETALRVASLLAVLAALAVV
jgi:hypothetical protein